MGKSKSIPWPDAWVSETDCAYAAGILDGEGCIHVGKLMPAGAVRPTYPLRIQVAMSDHHPIEWLAERFGGSVHQRKPDGVRVRRTMWTWTISGKQADHFLHRVSPYIQVKRTQTELALRVQLHRGHKSRPLSQDDIAALEEIRAGVSAANYSRKKVA